jgi:hypothetical protein
MLLPTWSWAGPSIELVSAAWCGAAIFGSSCWPPAALVVWRWFGGGCGWCRVRRRLRVQFGRQGSDPRTAGVACSLDARAAAPGRSGVVRSTSACGATVGFVRRRRRAAMWGWILRLGGLASVTWVWVNSARKHCIDLGRCRRCRRAWTKVPSLEGSSRSSFTSLADLSLRLSG